MALTWSRTMPPPPLLVLPFLTSMPTMALNTVLGIEEVTLTIFSTRCYSILGDMQSKNRMKKVSSTIVPLKNGGLTCQSVRFMQTGLPAFVIVRKKKLWNFHSKNDKFEIGLRQEALSNTQFV